MWAYLALACATLGLCGLFLPGAGKYAAVGLGLYAAAAGIIGYRRAGGSARRRLAAAGGVALGLVALGLGAAKVGLTLVAIDRLSSLFR